MLYVPSASSFPETGKLRRTGHVVGAETLPQYASMFSVNIYALNSVSWVLLELGLACVEVTGHLRKSD